MATVQLKNVKKVYPFVSGEDKKKNKKKADEPEKKKVNLQITDEGVVAVKALSLSRHSIWTLPIRNSSFWSARPAAENPRPCVWWQVWKRSLTVSSTSTAS